MGLFSTPIKTLDDLFTHTLQDIYYAENQIVKNLPTMIEKAHNPELKLAFQSHLAETQNQVQRLEQVFQMLGKPAKGRHLRRDGRHPGRDEGDHLRLRRRERARRGHAVRRPSDRALQR